MPPTWYNLPVTFKRQVVSKLDLRSRNSLRLCSKFDLDLVDQSKICLKFLKIYITNLGESMKIDVEIQELSDSVLKFSEQSISEIISKLKNSKIQDLYFQCVGRPFDKGVELINQLKISNFKIHAKKCVWRWVSGKNADEFLDFLECFDEKHLENILNDSDRFSSDQLLRLGNMKQFQNAQGICMANAYFESVDMLLNTRICSVRFTKLDSDGVWKMIQSYTRELPVGSSFYLISKEFPKLEDVLLANGVALKNEPVVLEQFEYGSLHTQKFKMAMEGTFLVVKNIEMGVKGMVVKDGKMEIPDLFN